MKPSLDPKVGAQPLPQALPTPQALPLPVASGPEAQAKGLTGDQGAEALQQLAQAEAPALSAEARSLQGFQAPNPTPDKPALMPRATPGARQGPNPIREAVYAGATALSLSDSVGGNAVKALSGLPAVVRGLQAVAADGGLFAKAAGGAAQFLGQAANFAKASPWISATSNFLGKMAPVIGVAYAAFDVAKASLEPEGPTKIRMEGGAAITCTSAVLGVASAAAGSLAAAATVAAGGGAVVGALALAAPVAVGLGVAAVGVGLLSMADGLFNGGRGQSWLGEQLRGLTGRSPLFW